MSSFVSVSSSPLSNKSAYEFLTSLQRELGAKFLPLNFKNVLKKCLNRFMKDVEVERVKFMVNFYYFFWLRFNLNLQEAGGKESEYYSALAFLKKIDKQALRLIRNRRCKNPKGLTAEGIRSLSAVCSFMIWIIPRLIRKITRMQDGESRYYWLKEITVRR